MSNVTNPMRVSATTDPIGLAGALVRDLREHNNVAYISGVGRDAVYHIVKAITVARGYVASEGDDLIMTPSFFTRPSDQTESGEVAGFDVKVTAIKK